MEQGGGRQWADAWDGAGQGPQVEGEREMGLFTWGGMGHASKWVEKPFPSRTRL